MTTANTGGGEVWDNWFPPPDPKKDRGREDETCKMCELVVISRYWTGERDQWWSVTFLTSKSQQKALIPSGAICIYEEKSVRISLARWGTGVHILFSSLLHPSMSALHTKPWNPTICLWGRKQGLHALFPTTFPYQAANQWDHGCSYERLTALW